MSESSFDKDTRESEKKRSWEKKYAIYEAVVSGDVKQLSPQQAERVAERMGELFARFDDEQRRNNNNRRPIKYKDIAELAWPGTYVDRGKLGPYVKVVQSRRRKTDTSRNQAKYYVRSPQKQAKLLDALIQHAGWDRYDTYHYVFKGNLGDLTRSSGRIRSSLRDDYEGFLAAVWRALRPLAQRYELPAYFREVTRYGLYNSDYHFDYWRVALEPSEMAQELALIDPSGAVEEGYLPLSGSLEVVQRPILLYGAIPAIPVCWLVLEAETYERAQVANIKVPDWQDALDLLGRAEGAQSRLNGSHPRWRDSNSIEILETAEIRLGFAPRNNSGDPGLIFEVISRCLVRTGDGSLYMLPGHAAWESPRPEAIAISGDNKASFVSMPIQYSSPVVTLFKTELEPSSSSVLVPDRVGTNNPLAIIGTPDHSDHYNLAIDPSVCHYVAFDEECLERLLVDTVKNRFEALYSCEKSGQTIFSPGSPAETLHRALEPDGKGERPLVQAMDRRLKMHIEALRLFQLRRRETLNALSDQEFHYE